MASLFRMDCSLRELTGLIKEVNPDARRRGTNYDFAIGLFLFLLKLYESEQIIMLFIVYPDPRSSAYRFRDVGSTVSGQRGVDDNKTLQQIKFDIGDYIDVAVTVPGGRPMMQNRRPY